MNTESREEKVNPMEDKPNESFRPLIRGFIIEIVIYGGLLVFYFNFVLRYLREPLVELFNSSLVFYAVAGLGLIAVQAFVLEFVTSLLFDFLGLHRLSR